MTSIETRKGIMDVKWKDSLCKQIALNKAIYFYPVLTQLTYVLYSVLLGFSEKLSNLVLLYSVIFWPESSTFTLPSFTKNRVATTSVICHPRHPAPTIMGGLVLRLQCACFVYFYCLSAVCFGFGYDYGCK